MAETFLVTGGSGFFGGILKRFLLQNGFSCISVDIEPDEDFHKNLTSVRCDIRDKNALDAVFGSAKIGGVFHCAAMLAHDIKDKDALWSSNVDRTENIARMCVKHGVEKIVHTSSNCLWAKNFQRPVKEDDIPEPIEIYGKSKWEGEKILLSFSDKVQTVIIRCPTIIEAGRVGLLGILFDFIREGRKVWMVGAGANRYQFIAAGDLADACLKGFYHDKSDTFHIGSDDVPTLAETYGYVIEKAATSARIVSVPKTPAVFAMKLAYLLGISPLGPYHYKMISEDFIFDTSKIKNALGWKPTLTNGEMLWKAYKFYMDNLELLQRTGGASAHKRSSAMGIIRLLKMVS